MKVSNRDKKVSAICLTIGLLSIAISCSSCGSGNDGAVGPQGPTGAVGATGPEANSNESQSVQALVDQANAYREMKGQTGLTPGLSCTVQLVGSGQWLSSSSPGYVASQGLVTYASGSTSYPYLLTTSFNQPDSAGNLPNSLIPTTFQSFLENQNYRIYCTGQIVITDLNYYSFETNSDDGPIVNVNGVNVVVNDGNHAMTDKVGPPIMLQPGVYSFSMNYAQSGAGDFGLIFSANGSVVPGNVWYH